MKFGASCSGFFDSSRISWGMNYHESFSILLCHRKDPFFETEPTNSKAILSER